MDNKIDIIGVFIKEDYGHDYFEGSMYPAEVYTYIFESNKQRYVWQSKEHYTKELNEGSTYHLKALKGDRLLGGRSLSINEVEIVSRMNIDNKVIRLITD